MYRFLSGTTDREQREADETQNLHANEESVACASLSSTRDEECIQGPLIQSPQYPHGKKGQLKRSSSAPALLQADPLAHHSESSVNLRSARERERSSLSAAAAAAAATIEDLRISEK